MRRVLGERLGDIAQARAGKSEGGGEGRASAGDALGRRGGQGGELVGGTIERAAS